MQLRRVVITGLGAVSPFGQGTERLFQALHDGESAVRYVAELETIRGLGPHLAGLVPDIDIKDVPRKIRRTMSPMSVYALLAAQEALAQANVDQQLRTGGRVGIALGSTVGSVETMEQFFDDFLKDRSIEGIKSMLFFKIMGHSCAANVAQTLGIAGRTLAPSAACATSCQAVGLGYEAIALGKQDIMLCGGADEFHPLTAATFDIIQAASTNYNDRPQCTPRPFDRDRDGIVCSEGAGILLLESIESATTRGARILAEISGFASTSDTSSIANPDPKPVRRCMELALAEAGLKAADIDYVNAHATGTIQGDEAESRAIGDLFGPNTPVSSLKGHMGHAMAASGALELIACVKMLETGKIIPTRNLDNPAMECSSVALLQQTENKELHTIIKNNFALGGVNCAIVLRRFSE